MNQQRQQQWQQILKMTDQLEDLAQQQAWEELPQLEAERQSQLQAFFSEVIEAEDVAELEQDIAKILESNKWLFNEAEQQQQQASAEVRKMSKGRQAIDAYKQFNK